MDKLNNYFTKTNITNGLVLLLALAILFVPGVKVFFISLMMRIGLMRAPNEKTVSTSFATVQPVKLTLRTPAGGLRTIDSIKGKILIINFWATWCPPCRAEMPSINELYQHYRNNSKVMILPVDADGKLAAAEEFMRKNGYDLPVYGLAGPLPPELNFESIPTTVILDSEHRVVARHEGAANYADKQFYAFIDELVRSIK